MNEESLEQYNRGLVRIYIENASIETLQELQSRIAQLIKYYKEMKKKNAKQ